MSDTLHIYALGGLGEFGKNLLVIQQNKDAVLLDCGAQFSDGRNPGLDIIIPDFSPLLDESITIHGILLTHAHEDHIGSVPYFLHNRNVPVYGTRYTQKLVSHKCKEFPHKIKLDYHLIDESKEFDVGPFHITPVAMAHSIVEALGFFVDTKFGSHFHTGDFKIDPDPVDGRKTELERIAEIAKSKKMLMLTSDSTNALVEGESLAENSLREGLQKAFDETSGKLIITSFASHIPRILQLCQLAEKNKRSILLLGRSIIANVKIGKELGYLKLPGELFVNEDQAKDMDPSKLLIISTGTQAEPRAALSKLTFGQIKGLSLGENDRVLFSSRAIPGNERAIYHLINHIYRTGADVWTWSDERIHASGHGYREDLKKIIEIINPTYMLPVHGELKMLKAHQKLAQECGVKKENTFFLETGDVLMFDGTTMKQKERLELAPKLVDGGMLVDLNAPYLRDRRKLAQQGVLSIVVTVHSGTHNPMHRPFVEDYGFIPQEYQDWLLDEIEDYVEREMIKLAKKPFQGKLEQQVRMWVNRICKRHIERKPIIVPIIIDA